MSEKMYTLGEVAKLFKVHPRTITRMVDRGELNGAKFSGKWLFSHEDVADAYKAAGGGRLPE